MAGLVERQKMHFFIDNQGVLDCLIKGYSSELHMKRLLCCFERDDSEDPCLPWFTRVPSPSNISDLPSRGKWALLKSLLDFSLVSAKCPATLESLQSIDG